MGDGRNQDPLQEMMRHFTKTGRFRAALALTLVYVLAVLAPASAMALSRGTPIAPCILEDHRSPADHMHHQGHSHSGNGAHDHGAGDDDESDPQHRSGACCGFMCISALPASLYVLFEPVHTPSQVNVVTPSLTGRTTERLSRPPASPTLR